MKITLQIIGSITLLVLMSFGLQGCAVAALTAAGAYASSTADKDIDAYHKNNTQREKAGLKPLSKEQWESQNESKSSSSSKKATKPASESSR